MRSLDGRGKGRHISSEDAWRGRTGVSGGILLKSDSIASYIEDLCTGVIQVDSSLAAGVGTRLPAFSPLTGYDLTHLAAHVDFLLPKIYLWMGGVDGLYGTVYRWVTALKSFGNPHLRSRVQAFRLRAAGDR